MYQNDPNFAPVPQEGDHPAEASGLSAENATEAVEPVTEPVAQAVENVAEAAQPVQAVVEPVPEPAQPAADPAPSAADPVQPAANPVQPAQPAQAVGGGNPPTGGNPPAGNAPAGGEEPLVIHPRPRVKAKRVWPRVLALVLCCALVGGGAGVGAALLTQRASGLASALRGGSTVVYEGAGTPVVVNLSKTNEGQVLTPAEVYASNVDAVVGITTQVTTNIWGQTVVSPASGSGFVLTADGYIVTNYHVVEDASSITVQFKNGDKYPATLVGSEAGNDVAVLKIDAQNLTPVRLGSSSDMVVGEQVAAIGNPLGEMTFSMTVGYISALDKPLTIDGSVFNVLQTDAAINSGNSGGPLFNMYGQVVGITNAKYSNNGSTRASIEGICFAIPIDDVKDVVTDLIEHGYVTGKPYAGVVLTNADADEAARYGRSGGAYVQEVIPDGPSAQAGLQAGDIITKVDDTDITSRQDFMTARDRHRAGDTVTLPVDRAGQLIQVPLTLGEQQPQAEKDADQSQEQTQTQTPNQGGGYGFGYDPFSWFGW